jgi:hypothetical protein
MQPQTGTNSRTDTNKGQQPGQNQRVLSEDVSRAEARKEREKAQAHGNPEVNTPPKPGVQQPVPKS